MPYRLLIFLLVFCTVQASAQDSEEPRRHWLVPHHAKLQYAGGIGFLAAGVGYANRKEKLEMDLFYGYVPKSLDGLPIHTTTAKFAWWPIRPITAKGLQVKPLATGLLVNYTFGKQYFAFSPEHYSFRYYDHPTSLHAGIFLGSAIQTKPNPNKRIRQWGLYYELLAYDVDIFSYAGNRKALSLADIVTLGIGVKAKF
ncbi:MAG: hypothetical protein JWP69_1475 [Flaviaesturariibacter sp.]|nr:hypothetical protein [Flaviaesturariibacter sp.]